jgi:hypothetical protein
MPAGIWAAADVASSFLEDHLYWVIHPSPHSLPDVFSKRFVKYSDRQRITAVGCATGKIACTTGRGANLPKKTAAARTEP